MNQNIQTMKKIVFNLRKEFGNVVSVDEVVRLGVYENIAKDEVMEAINALEKEGIVTFLDEETIEVNA